MAGILRTEMTDGIVVLTIDHAAKRNALDVGLCRELAAALAAAPAAGARAIVLTGAGERAFSSGFDLGGLDEAGGAERAFAGLIDAVASSPLPLVCALNGVAYGGGCELAASCDVRLAHAGVTLAMPPARLGIVYPERGLARFTALVGEARARRLFLFAETVGAETAAAWGLVDDVVGPEEVLPRARRRAAEVAALAPLAVAGMRRTFELLVTRRAELSAEARTEVEALRRAAWSSEDAAEARAAFAARRPPVWTGR